MSSKKLKKKLSLKKLTKDNVKKATIFAAVSILVGTVVVMFVGFLMSMLENIIGFSLDSTANSIINLFLTGLGSYLIFTLYINKML